MTEAVDPDSGLDDLSAEALLDLLADADHRDRTAARDKLLIAHQWAVVHPATPESGVSTWGGEALLADQSLGGEGCPQVAAYAAEPLAITLGVSPDTAKRLITDALELRHRLPETWKRVATLEIPAWKGRHVATLTHTLSLEAAGWVDQHIAPRLKRCGAKAVDTVVAHAIAKYDPARHAEREARAKKQVWDVVLHTPMASEYAATSELHITGDTLFLTNLYRHVCAKAAAAGKAGDDQPLGVRKAQALATLFRGDGGGVETVAARPPQPTPHQPTTVLYLHLDKTDLDDDTIRVGKAERLGPVTTDKIRDWLGASTVRIQPVIRMDGDDAVNGHDPPDRIRQQVILTYDHLPVPRLPSRRPQLRPRPRRPLRPRRSTRPNPTLQPRPTLPPPPQRQDHRSVALCPHARRRLPLDRAVRRGGELELVRCPAGLSNRLMGGRPPRAEWGRSWLYWWSHPASAARRVFSELQSFL